MSLTMAPETDRKEVAGIQYVLKRPALKREVHAALGSILGVSATCWDGEEITEQLKRLGFEVDDPRGQPLFIDELTEIFHANNLRLALTTTPGVRRWVLQLISLPDSARN